MRPSADAPPDLALARTALACLDLTRLGPTVSVAGQPPADTEADIDALCAQAIGAAGRGPVAAVCVWPRFVAQARAALPRDIRVAAVANFPQGALDDEVALRDAHAILDAGGDEVDLVLPWAALCQGDLAGPARLVARVRRATEGRVLKLILETGELRSPERITQAARLGLDAGVDFLKTSTGKTPVGATPEAARTLLQTLATHARAGEVGFKASGGVRTLADVAIYLTLAREFLGPEAGTPRRFRLGASALLTELEAVLRPSDGGAAPQGPGPAAGAY